MLRDKEYWRWIYYILIIGHMDTVFPKGTVAERPFTVKNNRAYGPGAADVKSRLLSIYYSMKLLGKKGFRLQTNSNEKPTKFAR